MIMRLHVFKALWVSLKELCFLLKFKIYTCLKILCDILQLPYLNWRVWRQRFFILIFFLFEFDVLEPYVFIYGLFFGFNTISKSDTITLETPIHDWHVVHIVGVAELHVQDNYVFTGSTFRHITHQVVSSISICLTFCWKAYAT